MAAATQRTTRMRIGHAVVLLPFHNPVMVAERIATLDLLSDGRIDVGVGRGLSPLEYEVFGGAIEESRERVDEGLEIMRRCWGDRPASFEGRFWPFPEIDVSRSRCRSRIRRYGRPRSHPRRSRWPPSATSACSPGRSSRCSWSPRTATGSSPAARSSARTRGELGFAMTLGVVVLDDAGRARAVAERHIRWFYERLLRLTARVLERGGESYRYYREELATLRELTGGAPSLEALEAAGMVIAGTPDYAIERFQKLADTGIDHVLCAVQAGGVPHADALRTIELLGERVIPALRETSPRCRARTGAKASATRTYGSSCAIHRRSRRGSRCGACRWRSSPTAPKASRRSTGSSCEAVAAAPGGCGSPAAGSRCSTAIPVSRPTSRSAPARGLGSGWCRAAAAAGRSAGCGPPATRRRRPRSSDCSSSYGERAGDPLGGPPRQRLDRQRRVVAAGGREHRAVDRVQVRDPVEALVGVDDARVGVVAHPHRPHLVVDEAADRVRRRAAGAALGQPAGSLLRDRGGRREREHELRSNRPPSQSGSPTAAAPRRPRRRSRWGDGGR